MQDIQDSRGRCTRKSSLLSEAGFKHGFSLRQGGVSAAPFHDLNLGRGLGDDPAAVEENHRRFAQEVGYAHGLLFEVSQVHGRHARFVSAGEEPRIVRAESGDALVTGHPGVAVGVRTADCVPVLVADPESGAVSAVHSGWRGTVAGILPEAIAQMCHAFQASPERLLVAIGPHIRQASFEVGADVAEQIQSAAPEVELVDWGQSKPHVDLSRVIISQLQSVGVRLSQVQDVGGCSFSEPGRYFSYRRDGAESGRHIAAIVAR